MSLITYELFKSGTLVSTDSAYTTPFNTYYKNSRSETLITKQDLETAGFLANDYIIDIELFVTEVSPRDLYGIRIGIKSSSLTTLPTGSLETYSTFTEVFRASLIPKSTLTPNSWVKFTFSTPYMWNGITNLIVTTMREDDSYTTGGKWNARTMTDSIVRYRGMRVDGNTFPYENIPLSGRANQPPAMRMSVTRGPQTIIGRGSSQGSASVVSTPETNTKYSQASIQASASASAVPLKIKSSTTPPITTNGLIGYWNSNQGISGTTWSNIAPSKLGLYNGTLVNGAVNSKDGVSFDGVNDHVTVPAMDNKDFLTKDITIEVWFNVASNTTSYADKHLVSTGFTPAFGFRDKDFSTYAYINDEGAMHYTKSLKIQNTVLNHGVYRYSYTKKSLHLTLNGVTELLVSKESDIDKMNLVWSGKALSFGKYHGTAEAYNHLHGYIPVVRIYNRTLNDDEVLEHYQFGTGIGLTIEPITHQAYIKANAVSESSAKPTVENTSITLTGQILMQSVSSITSTSRTVKSAQTSLKSVGSIPTIQSKVIKSSTVAISSVAIFPNMSVTVKSSGVNLNSVSTVNVIGSVTKTSVSNLSSVSTVEVVGVTIKSSSSVLNSVADIESVGSLTKLSTINTSSVGILSSTAITIKSSTATLGSVGNLISNGVTIKPSIVNMGSVGSLISTGIVIKPSKVTLTSIASLETIVLTTKSSVSSMTSASGMEGTASITRGVGSNLTGISSIQIESTTIKQSSITLESVSDVSISASAIIPVDIDLSSVGSMVSSASKIIQGSIQLTGVSKMSVRSETINVLNSSINIISASSSSIKASSVKSLSVISESVSILSARGVAVIQANIEETRILSSMVSQSTRISLGKLGANSVSLMSVYAKTVKESEVTLDVASSLHIETSGIKSSTLNMTSSSSAVVTPVKIISSDTNSVVVSLMNISATKILTSPVSLTQGSVMSSRTIKIFTSDIRLGVATNLVTHGSLIVSGRISIDSVARLILYADLTRSPGFEVTAVYEDSVTLQCMLTGHEIRLKAEQDYDINLRGVMK